MILTSKVLRLVFFRTLRDGTIIHYTKLGTFTNCILHTAHKETQQKRALRLYNNCILEEKFTCVGYCIDDGTFNTLNIPQNKIILWS